MFTARLILGLLGTTALHAVMAGSEPPVPEQWFISSQVPDEGERNYSASLDSSVVYSGSSSGVLKSTTGDQTVSGTLMQAASVGPYRGKRIEFRAYLRCRDVTQRAGLWIRAEDARGGVTVFRNSALGSPATEHRSYLRGDQDWTETDMTVEIPISSVAIFYGVQLLGAGIVWIDDVRIDVLGDADPATAGFAPVVYNAPPGQLSGPRNLDFER